MMGMGGSRSVDALVSLLSDPAAAKAALDAHKKAADVNRQATEEHKKAKAAAEWASEALEKKKSELDARERDITVKSQTLVSAAIDIERRRKQLDDQLSDVRKDRDLIDATYEYNRREAEAVLIKAKLDAAKIVDDQRAVAKKIVDEALEKDRLANLHRTNWQERSDSVVKLHEDLKDREESVVKREKLLADLANKLRI